MKEKKRKKSQSARSIHRIEQPSLSIPRPSRSATTAPNRLIPPRAVLAVSASLLLLLLLLARRADGTSDKSKGSDEELFSLSSTCCCEVPSSSFPFFNLPPLSASAQQNCSAMMMATKPAAPRGGANIRLPSLSAIFGGGGSSKKRAKAAARTLSSPVPKPSSASPSPCDRDLCIAAAAANSSEAAASPLSTSEWWRDDEDLWLEPRTKEEFERALAPGSDGGGQGGNKPEIVLVAFYASWCKGCRRLHPELTALAEEAQGGSSSASPLAGGKVRFVRVNYDRLRAVAASAGATVLPYVAAFAPGGGEASDSPLLGWQAVASKPGATRANLLAMLSSGSSALPPPGKKWAFPKASSSSSSSGDNGNGNAAAPLLPELVDAAEAEAADRSREVEKLAAQASTAGLFERLAAMAGSGGSGGSGVRVASPPPPPSVPHSAPSPPPSRNPLARATPELRQAFFEAYPGDYNPLAEPVAAAEVAPRLRGLVYLDATGSALYSNTQVDRVAADLREHAFGNPHTGPASPPAALSSSRIEEAREMVLEWFNADPGK